MPRNGIISTRTLIAQFFLSALVGLVSIQSVTAQNPSSSIVPDTLDWKRYYPLSIGNEWQYDDAESGPHTKVLLIAKIEANSHEYFVAEITEYAPETPPVSSNPWSSRIAYVRYDPSRIVVNISDLATDTVSVFDTFKFGFAVDFYHFDLQTSFGDSLTFPGPDFQYSVVSGGYQMPVNLRGQTLTSAAVKVFLSNGWWYQSYAADIGLLGGGNLWGPRLAYARIDGTEYGSPIIITSSEDSSSPVTRNVGDVYPNPANRYASVNFELASSSLVRVLLYDSIGRLVRSPVRGIRPPGAYTEHLNVFDIPNGVYFYRIQIGQFSATKSLTVIH